MADNANTGATDNQAQQTAETTANETVNNDESKVNQVNDEVLNRIIEEKMKGVSEIYKKTIDGLKSQNIGLDKKVSEYQKTLKKLETEKLTTEERLELEKREIADSWNVIWRQKALTKFFDVTDEEQAGFGEFLSGQNEDEIYKKAEKLKTYITDQIQKGIEKGIDEKLKQSYKPENKTQPNQNVTNDYAKLSKEELGSEAVRVSKMPAGKEKDEQLNKLILEQRRRFGGK